MEQGDGDGFSQGTVSRVTEQTRFILRCPAGCDGELRETNIRLPEGNLLRCSQCGHIVSQIHESDYLMTLKKFDTSTGTSPDEFSQGRHDQRAGRMFRRLRTMLSAPAGQTIRLLDIGCSTGALMMAAQRCGFEAEGVEPATRAAQAAQASGLKVFRGTLAEASYPSSSFQAGTLIEVIEHLRDPGEVLREIGRVLGPEGILIVGTGNAESWTVKAMRGRWDYFNVEKYGGHISFFTPHSLGLLAGRCGFRLERLETRRVRFTESFQASRVVYRGLKVLGEVLNLPASMMNRGHDMLAFLRKV